MENNNKELYYGLSDDNYVLADSYCFDLTGHALMDFKAMVSKQTSMTSPEDFKMADDSAKVADYIIKLQKKQYAKWVKDGQKITEVVQEKHEKPIKVEIVKPRDEFAEKMTAITQHNPFLGLLLYFFISVLGVCLASGFLFILGFLFFPFMPLALLVAMPLGLLVAHKTFVGVSVVVFIIFAVLHEAMLIHSRKFGE